MRDDVKTLHEIVLLNLFIAAFADHTGAPASCFFFNRVYND